MKKNTGAQLALYPAPVIVVGARPHMLGSGCI